MRQPFDLLGQAVGIESLKGVHNAVMESTPTLLQQAAVSHLMGERMLERVFELGEGARFVEEFAGLEGREAALQDVLR